MKYRMKICILQRCNKARAYNGKYHVIKFNEFIYNHKYNSQCINTIKIDYDKRISDAYSMQLQH